MPIIVISNCFNSLLFISATVCCVTIEFEYSERNVYCLTLYIWCKKKHERFMISLEAMFSFHIELCDLSEIFIVNWMEAEPFMQLMKSGRYNSLKVFGTFSPSISPTEEELKLPQKRKTSLQHHSLNIQSVIDSLPSNKLQKHDERSKLR